MPEQEFRLRDLFSFFLFSKLQIKPACVSLRNVQPNQWRHLKSCAFLFVFFSIKLGSVWKWVRCLRDAVVNVLCWFFLARDTTVFPEDSDADCEAHHGHQHALPTARLPDPHSGRLPHQPTNHDGHGPHAFPLPAGCTVLHPTGGARAPNHYAFIFMWHVKNIRVSCFLLHWFWSFFIVYWILLCLQQVLVRLNWLASVQHCEEFIWKSFDLEEVG